MQRETNLPTVLSCLRCLCFVAIAFALLCSALFGAVLWDASLEFNNGDSVWVRITEGGCTCKKEWSLPGTDAWFTTWWTAPLTEWDVTTYCGNPDKPWDTDKDKTEKEQTDQS